MAPPVAGNQQLFAWMIGALSGDFRARGELVANERRCVIRRRQSIGASAFCFRTRYCLDHFQRRAKLESWRCRRTCAARRETAVEEALSRVGLAGFAAWRKDPGHASGGQRARVSLLRALLARPEALLLR